MKLILLAAALMLSAPQASSPNLRNLVQREYGPEQTFKGRYQRRFEMSAFTAQGATERGWLTGSLGDAICCGYTHFEVEFVGRRTTTPGGYGHLNAYSYEVQVVRPIRVIPIL